MCPPLAQMEQRVHLPLTQRHPLFPPLGQVRKVRDCCTKRPSAAAEPKMPPPNKTKKLPHHIKQSFFTDFAQQTSLQQLVVGLGRLFKEVMFLKVQRLVIEGKGFCFLQSQRHSH